MNIIIVLVAVFAAVSANQQETFEMPPAMAEQVKKSAISCADENNLDHTIVGKISSGSVPDTESGRNFIYCVARTTGLVSEDGHIVADNLAQALNGHPLQNKFRDALNKCNEITKETPQATSLAMLKCTVEKAPVRLVF